MLAYLVLLLLLNPILSEKMSSVTCVTFIFLIQKNLIDGVPYWQEAQPPMEWSGEGGKFWHMTRLIIAMEEVSRIEQGHQNALKCYLHDQERLIFSNKASWDSRPNFWIIMLLVMNMGKKTYKLKLFPLMFLIVELLYIRPGKSL